jgi:hypothetical protein
MGRIWLTSPVAGGAFSGAMKEGQAARPWRGRPLWVWGDNPFGILQIISTVAFFFRLTEVRPSQPPASALPQAQQLATRRLVVP